MTGYPDNPPVRTGYAQIDYMTAYMGAFGVMTALYNREVNHTGGEIIDLSLAIRNIADLADDPHMREREAVMAFNDPEKGEILIPGVFPKMSRFPGRVKFFGAKLGEYNHEIYGGLIGLSNDEISELKDKGVI